MMEQDESRDFKTLKAWFQGENGLKIQTKPDLPEKPKTIPPSTKVSNPLISSIKAAVQKGSLHAPRVVFKEDNNLSRPLSPPWELKTRENQPISNDELLDNKQVNTSKQNLKDKNPPLVLPVVPKTKTPEPDSSPRTPVSASPVKVTTPKKFVFTPQKTNKDECEKTDLMKEVNTTKKSLKDRNFPLVLPVPSKKAISPEPEPSPLTPASVPSAKVSTPKSFVFTPQKISQDENEKADTVKEVDTAKKSLKDRNLPLVLPVPPIKADTPEPEPSPYTPRNSTPHNFVFTTQKTSKDENEEANTVERPTPASRTPAPNHSAPAGPSVTATPPTQSVPVVPKAVVPSQASTGIPSVPNIPAPSIPAPGSSTSASPEPKIPEPAIPTPSQAVPKSKPETSISYPPDTEPSKPNIHMLNLSEVFPPPEGSPPPEFTDIPPPVFGEDFPDGDFSEQTIRTPAIRTSIVPVPRSQVVSRSPAPSTPPAVSSEPLVNPLEYTPAPVSSPPPEVYTPAAPLDMLLENAKTLTDKAAINPERSNEHQSSTKPLSALSALARAEEMASVKRSPNDSRVFNLLERAKRKSTVSPLATTPENTSIPGNTTLVETATPEIPLPETPTPLPKTATVEVTQPDLAAPEKALPQLATTLETLPYEAQPVPEVSDNPKLPPVDYVDHARLPPKTYPSETAEVNGFDHRVVTVVKPVNPPPPPPRKVLPATPIVDPPLETRTQTPARDLQIPTTPSEPLETHDSLYDNSFEFYEDVEEPKAPALSTFRPPSVPSLASSTKRPVSAHEEAFLRELSLKQQLKEDMFPNMDDRDVDYGSMNSGSPYPEAQAAVHQDSVRSSPALTPSGTLERGDNVFDDQVDSKKGKTTKTKKQKGPPKNPYADAPAAVEETPKKILFSRKNSGKVVDDKELKKKEKQREKEKEKEKEREKKEQKEKEKKENEIRKKFKITGQEEPIYHVKVIEDCKGRKNDLPVKVGETVSIIRTNNCPKGKWLAKDSNNKYGYVPVESVDLNISGIMELGKMTTASNRPNGNGLKDPEVTSTGSRTSEHYGMNNESFSEDSEEWTCDDDDPVFGSANETAHIALNQSQATPAQGESLMRHHGKIFTGTLPTGNIKDYNPVHQDQRDSTYMNMPKKQEAIQKLSTFFMQPKTSSQPLPRKNSPIMPELTPEDPDSLNKEEKDLDVSDLQILPPPDLYADIIAGESMTIYSKPIKLVSK
ncbi:titin isoform X2 [Onychostoma macrolepis]|uniref:titin isoform X2 n=1 Tax=Onychostoma macrolepis TaxID=369639 RepID=UPI002729D9C8|nr:titin isoform X2 [Onychostoma macrolepis]